jgi:hypothetical protein
MAAETSPLIGTARHLFSEQSQMERARNPKVAKTNHKKDSFSPDLISFNKVTFARNVCWAPGTLCLPITSEANKITDRTRIVSTPLCFRSSSFSLHYLLSLIWLLRVVAGSKR